MRRRVENEDPDETPNARREDRTHGEVENDDKSKGLEVARASVDSECSRKGLRVRTGSAKVIQGEEEKAETLADADEAVEGTDADHPENIPAI